MSLPLSRRSGPSPRIVVLGATGFTGEFVAQALVKQGVRPVLAGRNAAKLESLAEKLGAEVDLEIVDVTDPSSVTAAVGRGDVLISTVGPFVKHGAPAVAAAASVGAHYFDSTGEGPFIRDVFENYGPVAQNSGAALLTAFGYDYVPGNLAGALALERAGSRAVRVDTAYFMTDAHGERDLRARMGLPSSATIETILALATDDGYTLRNGRIGTERVARRVGTFRIGDQKLSGVSIGGVEQFALPREYPQVTEANVYLGWFDPFSRPLQVVSALNAMGGSPARAITKAAIERFGGRLTAGRPAGPPQKVRDNMRALIVGAAYDRHGEELARTVLRGPEPYVFTGDILAWGAIQALNGGLRATGALGAIDAFGLEALRDGCAEAGLIEEKH